MDTSETTTQARNDAELQVEDRPSLKENEEAVGIIQPQEGSQKSGDRTESDSISSQESNECVDSNDKPNVNEKKNAGQNNIDHDVAKADDLLDDKNEDMSASGTDVNLKVALPECEDKDNEKMKDVYDPESEAGCSSRPATACDGEINESIYHVKWVYFKKKQVPIITQNENGPCPLLAIMNVLLMQDRVRLAPQTEVISASQLMTHLGDCVLQNVPDDNGMTTPSMLNFQQNMGDAMAVMHKLQTGLDVNVRFTGVREFEYTTECIIFDLLQITLYHGWLVDPQNQREVTAVGNNTYNQLVERIIGLKSSADEQQVQQALIAEQFLENSASQLTYHGLSELGSQLKHDELAVLFRNNHFTTLYRNKDELFQLVTDQGFLTESNVVWETLSNVEGDCHFVDSGFRNYTKPEPPPLSMEPSNVEPNSDEQIDQDYLVALSLQQEQQQHQQPAWEGSPPMSDEELAKRLQEEEQRAALAEQSDAGRRQQQGGVAGGNRYQGGGQGAYHHQQRGGGSRPRADRERDRDKKSDCCIL